MTMKSVRFQFRLWLLLAVAAVLLSVAPPVLADGPNYRLDWWTVDGGGTTSPAQETGYSLSGTVGQPDAAVWTDGHYTLLGGFWAGAAVSYQVYLPLVLRGYW
jgi:hypothetical protein